MSDLEDQFEAYVNLLAPDLAVGMVREYRIVPTRRWRFDAAWVQHHVAVELDGGVFTTGRHTRGAGYEADCEKLNEAAVRGWRVLRFTAGMLERDPETCIAQVRALIEGAALEGTEAQS